ncbi:MAG: RNase adapter RapZ [Candidatus Eutrophobiaceae bacterium]
MSNGESSKILIIVSGISGAGKSSVLNILEDAGYYCVDILPVQLLESCLDLLISDKSPATRMAVGVDARNAADLEIIPELLERSIPNLLKKLVFLHAANGVLMRRFNETRRKHPLTSNEVNLQQALRIERESLGVLAENATLRIDTSNLSQHALRKVALEQIMCESNALSLQIMSFGYKNGLPRDADFTIDVRCLPNPYWEKGLRNLNGEDPEVVNFLESPPLAKQLLKDLIKFFDKWIPLFEQGNRSYLTIAIGCTGGQHRSVYMAQRLKEHFESRIGGVFLRHRDIEKAVS